MKEFLSPSFYVDSDNRSIVEIAKSKTEHLDTDKEKAIVLYLYVRDHFYYDPYKIDLRGDEMKASALLNRSFGYCGEKACYLAALGRAIGIPSRLGYARVRNHIGTALLEELLKTDEIVFHGFTEFLIDGKWVKCTPAFNKGLCDKIGVEALDFDGENDSIFQEFGKEGHEFMTYTHNYGSFSDIPVELMFSELKKFYPHIFEVEEFRHEDAYFLVPKEHITINK